MKQTGIIMSGNHPKLILDGLKTMTRRVIKLKEYSREIWDRCIPHDEEKSIFASIETGQKLPYLKVPYDEIVDNAGCRIFCPYGQVGDRLYLKESHNLTKWWLEGEWWIKAEYRFDYKGDNGIRWFKWADIPEQQKQRLSKIRTWGKWRPARFMYKFLARIWLEITEVRVERLQEISDPDVDAEGLSFERVLGMWKYNNHYYDLKALAYAELWDSLNAKRKPTKYDRERGITELITPSYAWASNPWVWVINFTEIP